MGQTPPTFQRGFTGYAMLGLNASQIDGDGISGFDLPGLMLGVAAVFHSSPEWSFGPEFYFSQKGSRTTQQDLENGLPFRRYRQNYIELPVLAHYQATPTLALTLGPSFNALLSANLESGSAVGDITDAWRPLDVGVTGGVEARLTNGISFVGRWYYSLIPAENSDLNNFTGGQVIFQGQGLRNNTLSAMLKIRLGGARNDFK